VGYARAHEKFQIEKTDSPRVARRLRGDSDRRRDAAGGVLVIKQLQLQLYPAKLRVVSKQLGLGLRLCV